MTKRIIFTSAFYLAVVTMAAGQDFTWEERNGGFGGTPTKFVRFEDDVVLLGTSEGGMVRSTDAGSSWRIVTSGLTNQNIVSLCSGENGKSAYCTVGNSSHDILMSTDEGLSWNVVGNTPEQGQKVLVLDDGTMYAYGNGKGTYYSVNGIDWEKQTNSAKFLEKGQNGYLFAATYNAVYRFRKGDSQWEKLSYKDRPEEIVYINIAKNGYWFVVSLFEESALKPRWAFVYLSTNEGDNWAMLWTTEQAGGPVDAAYDNIIYYVMYYSSYIRDNEGNSWRTDSYLDYSDMELIALNKGHVINYTSRGIRVTGDTCKNWGWPIYTMSRQSGDLFTIGENIYLQKTGYSSPGTCYSSNDYGLVWIENPYTQRNRVQIADVQSYKNVTYAREVIPSYDNPEERIIRTTDDGSTWDTIYPASSFLKYYYISNDKGAVVIVHGDTMIVSTDFGDSWVIRRLPRFIPAIVLSDDLRLYYGDNSGFYESTDLGNSWNNTSLQPCVSATLAYFDGAIIQQYEGLYSHDKGATWEKILNVGPDSLLQYFQFMESGQGIIARTSGKETIYSASTITDTLRPISGYNTYGHKFKDIAVIGDSIYAKSEVGVYLGYPYKPATGVGAIYSPLSFTLSAPYPNPVTSSATVNFTLQSQANISLKLVDVLGRTVTTVDEGSHPPGTHTATVNTAALRPGTYFLRLETPQGIRIKPLAVVR